MKGNFAVLGLQWGDEGKGKIVNFLCDLSKNVYHRPSIALSQMADVKQLHGTQISIFQKPWITNM